MLPGVTAVPPSARHCRRRSMPPIGRGRAATSALPRGLVSAGGSLVAPAQDFQRRGRRGWPSDGATADPGGLTRGILFIIADAASLVADACYIRLFWHRLRGARLWKVVAHGCDRIGLAGIENFFSQRGSIFLL